MTNELTAWLTQIWDEQEARERSKHRAVVHVPAARTTADGDGIEIQMVADGPWTYLTTEEYLSSICEPAPDPQVLARIAADRQILELHKPDREPDTWYWLERECKECRQRWHADTPAGTPQTVIGPETGCPTVRLLALPYAGRPGYREEWRP